MPDIGQPSETDKNDPDEIRDGVVSDATRFRGGFIDEQITEAGAAVQIFGQFEVTTASFGQSFDVSNQDIAPTGVTFKPDGSLMYVVGSGTTTLYQYSLSTGYDVSTTSFSQSFDLSAQTSIPRGVQLKPDGSQMYVVSDDTSEILQYSLSTAFDVTTASFSQSFDVSTQDGFPQALALQPDGSRLYIAGNGTDSIYQYSLSTSYDVSTASFSQSFDVSSQDGSPAGLVFKPDGSRMYMVGENNGSIFQYSVSTAFDVSTASFSKSLDVTSQDGGPKGLAFKPDGTHMYMIGSVSDSVHQYAVGVTGFEIG